MATDGRAEHLFRAIVYNLQNGILYCKVAQLYRMAFEEKLIPLGSWLNRCHFFSCRDEAILCIAKLLDPGKQAASLLKLLNWAEGDPRDFVFDPGIRLDFTKAIATHRETIIQHDLPDRIYVLRDKTLAHTDLSTVVNPAPLCVYNR